MLLFYVILGHITDKTKMGCNFEEDVIIISSDDDDDDASSVVSNNLTH